MTITRQVFANDLRQILNDLLHEVRDSHLLGLVGAALSSAAHAVHGSEADQDAYMEMLAEYMRRARPAHEPTKHDVLSTITKMLEHANHRQLELMSSCIEAGLLAETRGEVTLLAFQSHLKDFVNRFAK